MCFRRESPVIAIFTHLRKIDCATSIKGYRSCCYFILANYSLFNIPTLKRLFNAVEIFFSAQAQAQRQSIDIELPLRSSSYSIFSIFVIIQFSRVVISKRKKEKKKRIQRRQLFSKELRRRKREKEKFKTRLHFYQSNNQ